MTPTAYIIYNKYFSKSLFSQIRVQKPIRIIDYSQEKAIQRFYQMYPHALISSVEHGNCKLLTYQKK